MDTYTVSFRFRSGVLDQHTLKTDAGDFTGWNTRIRTENTISFYDVDGDLIVINTRHLETYSAVKQS